VGGEFHIKTTVNGRESLPRAFGGAAILSKPFSHQQLLDAASSSSVR
jgi:hypothetical protein